MRHELMKVPGVIDATVTHVDNAAGTAEVTCESSVEEADLLAVVKGQFKATVKKP